MSDGSLVEEKIRVSFDNRLTMKSERMYQLREHNSSFPRLLCSGKLDHQ